MPGASLGDTQVSLGCPESLSRPPGSPNCSQLTSVLGCFRGGGSRCARKSKNRLANRPRRSPWFVLTCIRRCRLLAGLSVQVWWHLSSVVEVLSDGRLWASGAMYFNKISLEYRISGLHKPPMGWDHIFIKYGTSNLLKLMRLIEIYTCLWRGYLEPRD
jgi:hypothetical protein